MTDENIKNEKKPNVFSKICKFTKDNSGTVGKIIIHQIGLTIFGFLLYSAFGDAGTAASVGVGAFSALFYLVLLYVLSWDIGAKDKIRIDGGRMKLNPFKGAGTALLASIPNLFLGILALLGYLLASPSVFGQVCANIYAIAHILGTFLNCMYMGIADPIGLTAKPFYILIVSVPAILVCGLGYFLGTKEKLGVFTSAPKNQSK